MSENLVYLKKFFIRMGAIAAIILEAVNKHGTTGIIAFLIVLWLKVDGVEKKVDKGVKSDDIMVLSIDAQKMTLSKWTSTRDRIMLKNSMELGTFRQYDYPGFGYNLPKLDND